MKLLDYFIVLFPCYCYVDIACIESQCSRSRNYDSASDIYHFSICTTIAYFVSFYIVLY